VGRSSSDIACNPNPDAPEPKLTLLVVQELSR
jgi:hypothetical protein